MKAVVCSLLAVVLLCTCVAADSDCSSMQDCGSCTKKTGCVWCFRVDATLSSETSSEEPICVEGSLNGPKDEKCVSYRYLFCSRLFLL